jgi:hypothetical protein
MNLTRLVLVAACATSTMTPAAEPVIASTIQEEISAGLEQVFVFRTARTSRTRGPTPGCQAAGFVSNAEDVYRLWSIDTVQSTGRVKNAHVRGIGEFHACFGAATATQTIPMYATGAMGDIGWTGRGECVGMAAQPPEPAVRALNCNLRVEGLPAGYAGGWLTSSSLAPVLGANAPPDAHVRGYVSTSIVVLRLWRSPTAPLSRQ